MLPRWEPCIRKEEGVGVLLILKVCPAADEKKWRSKWVTRARRGGTISRFSKDGGEQLQPMYGWGLQQVAVVSQFFLPLSFFRMAGPDTKVFYSKPSTLTSATELLQAQLSFWTGLPHVALAGFTLATLLPSHCWGCGHMPSWHLDSGKGF